MPVVKVDENVYKELIKIQGLLQVRDKKHYSFNDVIKFLLSNAHLLIPIKSEEGLEVVEK